MCLKFRNSISERNQSREDIFLSSQKLSLFSLIVQGELEEEDQEEYEEEVPFDEIRRCSERPLLGKHKNPKTIQDDSICYNFVSYRQSWF